MMRSRQWAGLFLIGCMTIPVQASTIDALVVKLAGDDEVARAEARQMLSRGSSEAVDRVLPLLKHEKEVVWRAAFNVLADFAHQVSVPGRESERVSVTAAFMKLLGADQPQAVKVNGLKLLALVAPAGFDVAPVAKLLADAELSDEVIAALEEMGTPEACGALRDRLAKTDAKQQVAILNALARLHDSRNVQAAMGLLDAKDAAVRAAALRAIAWAGDPQSLGKAKRIVTGADEATRADAMDGMLRLLTAMADRGGNWQIVVDTYHDMLPNVRGVAKDAVLAGLGRIGDGTCVAPVLAAIKDEQNPTRLVGIAALRSMQGVDVARQLVASYSELSPDLQLALLPVLGDKHHALVVPVLKEAIQSPDKQVRTSALAALGESAQPEGLEPLGTALRGQDAEEKKIAQAALLVLADALRASGKTKEAGAAYAAILQGAGEKELQRRAVEGVAACPSVEAYPAIQAAAKDKDLRGPAIGALIAVADVLAKAGRKDAAMEAYETARGLQPPMASMQAIAKGMHALGANVSLPDLLGIVAQWWVVGPFDLGEGNKGWDVDYIGEPDVSISGAYMSGKTRVKWAHVVSGDSNGKVDLRKTVADRDNCIGYAYTEITVKEATDAVLQLGVDDSERIWVNGKKVFELWLARGITPDQDKVPVKLKAGRNRILLKIWQNSLGWEFCMRVTRPDGSPVQFEQKVE